MLQLGQSTELLFHPSGHPSMKPIPNLFALLFHKIKIFLFFLFCFSMLLIICDLSCRPAHHIVVYRANHSVVIFKVIFRQKSQTFSGFSFLNARICCFINNKIKYPKVGQSLAHLGLNPTRGLLLHVIPSFFLPNFLFIFSCSKKEKVLKRYLKNIYIS